MFLRLAQQHQEFIQDLVMNLQALTIALERRGYTASCYTCGDQMQSASFMVSLGEKHLIRFLVSDYGITWMELWDDRELMKLEVQRRSANYKSWLILSSILLPYN